MRKLMLGVLTGATVMAAHAAFGMLPGVDRPALAAAFPTVLNTAAILVDVASRTVNATVCPDA